MPKPNKWSADCHLCGGRVEAEMGVLDGKDPVTDRFRVKHDPECPPRASAVEFPPTVEQQACIDCFLTGESMVIEAGAGAGKTSTLRLLAHAAPERRMQYIAFNVDIAEDVQDSMPRNVNATNVHKLAHTAIVKGTPFNDRFRKSERMTQRQVANFLHIGAFIVSDPEIVREAVALDRKKVAGVVLATVKAFCQSADTTISRKHVPYVDGLDVPPTDSDGRRVYTVNNLLAEYIEPFAEAAWRDIESHWGQLPFGHDHYLKLWQLSHPRINADVILFDEAQDANPVMAAVVAEQTHAQCVYVGDAQQSIYEFTGAVNAIQRMKDSGMAVRQLTKSFRFGQPIADAANELLVQIPGSDLRIVGFEAIESFVGRWTDGELPDAILCRTNAGALTRLIEYRERGVNAGLVGGGKELQRFAVAARELMEDGYTGYAELACFKSWVEVQKYVEEEEQGADLKLNVDLIDKFGIAAILDILGSLPDEDDEGVKPIISTAHKSKGRQWPRVLIASDFVREVKEGEEPKPPTPAELRLQYVACTRAQTHLDHTALTDAGAA